MWIAKRLGWSLESVSADKTACRLVSREGISIAASFVQSPEKTPVSLLEMRAPGAVWTVQRNLSAGFWKSTSSVAGVDHEYLTPATVETPAELAIERLRRGCNNRLYFSILREVQRLL